MKRRVHNLVGIHLAWICTTEEFFNWQDQYWISSDTILAENMSPKLQLSAIVWTQIIGNNNSASLYSSVVQCSTVQRRAVRFSMFVCSAVQCSAVQCSAVQYSTVQCSAVQCKSVFNGRVTTLERRWQFWGAGGSQGPETETVGIIENNQTGLSSFLVDRPSAYFTPLLNPLHYQCSLL